MYSATNTLQNGQNSDTMLAIAAGAIPGVRHINQVGRNSDIDT